MSRRKIMGQMYLTPDQMDRLRALHESSRVPMAELVRQGVDLVLDRRDAEVRAGLTARAGRES